MGRLWRRYTTSHGRRTLRPIGRAGNPRSDRRSTHKRSSRPWRPAVGIPWGTPACRITVGRSQRGAASSPSRNSWVSSDTLTVSDRETGHLVGAFAPASCMPSVSSTPMNPMKWSRRVHRRSRALLKKDAYPQYTLAASLRNAIFIHHLCTGVDFCAHCSFLLGYQHE